MKYRLSLTILAIVGVMAGILSLVQNHDDDECGLLDLHHECDLSGWLSLILGDLLIGVSLALVFHFLISHSNMKIENVTTKVGKIISEQQNTRNRRSTYVIQALKNHFSSILLCMGIINTFSSSDDEKKRDLAVSKRRDMERILDKGHATLGLSIDVLDPMLVEQIDRIFTSVADGMSADSGDGRIPEADKIKAMIKDVTARLNEYEHSANILK